jgi:predicted negative regulator of RcsB-dependent stress response
MNFSGLVRARQKGAIVTLIALSTLLITPFARSYYSARRDAAAHARFGQVIRDFDETVTVGNKSEKERLERIIIEARKITDEYGSSPDAQLARYYVAISEERLGNTDRSVQHLRELIRDGDPMMKPLAQFALVAIYRNHGDTPRAMVAYKDLEASGALSRRGSHSAGHSGAH